MISATTATLRTRGLVNATWHRAASVTIRKRIAKPRVTAWPSESASVMPNTAAANVSGAQIVTATRPDCRKNARLILLGRWNTSLTEITPAPLVMMASESSAVIRILRIAEGVTRVRASESETEGAALPPDVRKASGFPWLTYLWLLRGYASEERLGIAPGCNFELNP